MGKRYLAVAFAAAASFLVTAAPGQTQEKLLVGAECTYIPFNYRDSDGVLKGYEIDITNELSKRLNITFDYVCMKFDGLIPALLAGKFDLIAASMSITEDRRQKIDFSVPYRISLGQFVAPKAKKLALFNPDGSVKPEAFKGIRVGIERGTTYDNWFRAIVPDAGVVRYEGTDALYLDLKAGRLDAIMTNPMKTYLEFLSKPDGAGFEVVGPQITDEKYFGIGVGIGLRKDNAPLLKRIDTALLEMRKDGTLDRFSKKYFPFAIYPIN
ncbi:MAG: transporter substrate-binding domain-containing protein [Alphaproteobacteria bacterium]|nr:transporter substrate-binding domain-containing protein [Alphaproteobacteria bacterium]